MPPLSDLHAGALGGVCAAMTDWQAVTRPGQQPSACAGATSGGSLAVTRDDWCTASLCENSKLYCMKCRAMA